MKTIPPFIYLLFFSFILNAQTPAENLAKYRVYRDRLLGKDGGGGFISIGSEAGQSIPAAGRNPYRSCSSDWHLLHAGCQTNEKNGLVQWSDATVYLGHYISVLALEYKNSAQVGSPTQATLEELGLAIHAVFRLDSMAETFLGMPPAVNGFLLRDDVPSDFQKKMPTFNCIRSDASCQEIRFISQDQLLALFMGFLFVCKFVPDSVCYNGESLVDKCRQATHLMAYFLQQQRWRIALPSGEKITNQWGGDARGFSFSIAKAAANITKNKYQRSYQTGFSKTWGRLINGVFKNCYPLVAGRNSSMIFQAALLINNWKPNGFARRTKAADQAVYALADAVVNNKTLGKKFSKTDFETILNTAPLSAPCFGTPDCQAPDGWKSYDRWWHARHKDGNPYGVYFEFSGIDYMFAYNLYHSYYCGELPAY